MSAGRGPPDPRALGPAEKARSAAQRHGEGLRAVNEKLAALVTSLRDQRQRLVELTQPGARPQATGEPERPADGDLAQRTLAAELALAREALLQRAQDEERIRERLTEIQQENRRLCDEHAAVQRQSADLASLYAAVDRLYAARGRAEVLAVIHEIAFDVVGAAQLAVLERSPDGALTVIHAAGLTPADLAEVTARTGPVARTAAGGAAFVAADPHAPDAGLTACVPLQVGGEVVGAIAVLRLLAHKRGLTELDREIFALLERHAGLALHASALRLPPEGPR